MFWKKADTLWETTRSEQRDAINRLINQGTFRNGYYLFLVLAALITTPGLLFNATSVVFGGMVLAPLMVPMMTLALSMVVLDMQGIFRALRILILSALIVVAVAAAMSAIFGGGDDVMTWIPQRQQTNVFVLIAFCSGLAGAFAYVKEHLAPTFPGVAMAVSLLPPLCTIGIALEHQDAVLLKGSALLFGVNVAGITVAGMIAFLLLGFLRTSELEKSQIKKAEKSGAVR